MYLTFPLVKGVFSLEAVAFRGLTSRFLTFVACMFSADSLVICLIRRHLVLMMAL